MLRRRPLRVLVSLSGVVLVTYVAYRVIPVNATTVGFVYLLLILIVASTWGFLEAALASVLATLVFNFFFLPPVGTFTIADPQNWVALSKSIPADEQLRIFDRFYRSPSVKRQIPGSGLGLSIAHGIVRAHNGELTVSSRPGLTTFRITLPVHREEAA